MKVPRAVLAAFREGLALYTEGYGGKGLRPATVREARSIVRTGTMSVEKFRRMRAWLARHGASKMEVKARAMWSPARTAWLLWGGSPAERWARKVTLP